MKKLLLLTLLLSINAFSQTKIVTKESDTKTKLEAFTSKYGTINKFIDYSLPPIKKTMYTTVECCIRKVIIGSETMMFFQITKIDSRSGTSVASIAYSDLEEMLKALTKLKSEVEDDVKLNPDYLENKFTSQDGFMIGYYVKKGKITWYINFEDSGSDSTFFGNDILGVEKSFTDAKSKIEALKK